MNKGLDFDQQVEAVIDLLRTMDVTIEGARNVLEWAARRLMQEPLAEKTTKQEEVRL